MKVYIFFDYDGEVCSVSTDFVTGLSFALKELCAVTHSHVGNYFYVCDEDTKEAFYAGFVFPDKMWDAFGGLLTYQTCELH